jgi:hypothetical protein
MTEVSVLIPLKIQRELFLLMILLIFIIKMMLQAAKERGNAGKGVCTDTCEDLEGAVATGDIVDTNDVTGS